MMATFHTAFSTSGKYTRPEKSPHTHFVMQDLRDSAVHAPQFETTQI